jgi:ubiquitin carboxyl-terminal hydrolase 14
MNSSLQCLFSVPELRSALSSFGGGGGAPAAEHDGAARLTAATRDLFGELARGGGPVTPFRFLATLRSVFPQFAAQGRGGVYLQQDAEECWTGILETLRQRLSAPPGAPPAGAPAYLRSLFGIDLVARLRCDQTGEERVEAKTEYTLKCNIVTASTYMTEGFKLALAEAREAHSAVAGATVLFKGTSAITRLPRYLTAQMMRFEFNRVTSERCKKTGEISFSVLLDMHDFCTPELQATLEAPRRRVRARACRRAMLHAPPYSPAAAAQGGVRQGVGQSACARYRRIDGSGGGRGHR